MDITTMINELGQWFCKENFAMLVQSSVLIAVLMLLDLVIKKRVRAVIRYCIWMLVLVKLVLPTSISMPTGLGYWISDQWSMEARTVEQPNSREEISKEGTREDSEAIAAADSMVTDGVRVVRNGAKRNGEELTETADSGGIAANSGKVSNGNGDAAAEDQISGVTGLRDINILQNDVSAEKKSAGLPDGMKSEVRSLKSENEEIKNSEFKNQEEEEKGYGIRDKGLGNVLANARLINNEEATTKKGTENLKSEVGSLKSENEEKQLAAGNQITWQGWIFMGWSVGVLVLVSVLVQRFWFVKSLVAQSEPVKAERIRQLMAECRELVRVSSKVELRLTRNMMSPAACGLWKPVILMPEELLEKLSKDQLKAVLLHELSHIKRGDLWVNLAQTLLQIVYFFNPLLWIANAIIRNVREKAVDELVIAKLEGDAGMYSSTLVDIAEIAFSRPHFSLRLVGVVESKKALKDRIKHILSRKFPKSARLGAAGIVSIIVLAAVLLPMASGQGAQDKYIFEYGDGHKIELVGICSWPPNGNKWHSPDGMPLDIKIQTSDSSGIESDEPGYQLAFRSDKGAAFKLEYIKGCRAKSELGVFDKNEITAFKAHINGNLNKTNIRIAVPDGNWETSCSSRSITGTSGHKVDGKPLIFGGMQSGDNMIITCSDNVGYKKASRIVVIDKSGKIVDGKSIADTGFNNVRQRTIEYKNIGPADIDKIEFMTCSYKTHTFKNVVLKSIPKNLQFRIEGTVTDADTGDPIAGAKVGDVSGYNSGRFSTTTDENGKYEYLTYYEEHNIVAKAAGYETKQEILLTKLIGKEDKKTIDFNLKDERKQGSGIGDKGLGKVLANARLINNEEATTKKGTENLKSEVGSLKSESEEIKNSELKIKEEEEEEEEEKGYGIRDKGLGNVLADARLINNEEATTKKGMDNLKSEVGSLKSEKEYIKKEENNPKESEELRTKYTLSELLKNIQNADNVRSQLLSNSQGKALINITLSKMATNGKGKLQDESVKKFDTDDYSCVIDKNGNFTIDWYQSVVKRRFDLHSVDQLNNTTQAKPLWSNVDARTFIDPNKWIVYDAIKDECSAKNAKARAKHATNPLSIIFDFDIERLYSVNLHSQIRNIVLLYANNGTKPKIAAETVNGIPCIKISIFKEAENDNGNIMNKLIEFWVSPEMGHSLIKYRFSMGKWSQGIDLPLWQSYDASYIESKENHGVWLLNKLEMSHKDITMGNIETLRVEFVETEIDTAISGEVFTTKGLGVTDKTKFVDKLMEEKESQRYGEEIKKEELKIKKEEEEKGYGKENIKDEVSSIKYKKNSNTKDGKDAEMGTDPINSLDIKQEWKTIAESYKVNSNIPVQVASVATDYGQVVFGNAYSKDDGAWISTTDDIDRNICEVRIVAIDIDGNILLQNGGGSSTVNKTNTLQCRFDTELSKVSLFEIQIRNNETTKDAEAEINIETIKGWVIDYYKDYDLEHPSDRILKRRFLEWNEPAVDSSNRHLINCTVEETSRKSGDDIIVIKGEDFTFNPDGSCASKKKTNTNSLFDYIASDIVGRYIRNNIDDGYSWKSYVEKGNLGTDENGNYTYRIKYELRYNDSSYSYTYFTKTFTVNPDYEIIAIEELPKELTSYDKRRIANMVSEYREKMRKRDIAGILEMLVIEDDKHLEMVKQYLEETLYGKWSDWNFYSEENNKFVDVYEDGNNNFEAWTLTKSLDDKWTIGVIPVRYKNGEFKLDNFNKETIEKCKIIKTTDIDSMGKILQQKNAEGWVHAEGKELKKLYLDKITHEQRSLATLSVADKYKLEMMRFCTREEIEKRLNELESMTPEELKEKMISEALLRPAQNKAARGEKSEVRSLKAESEEIKNSELKIKEEEEKGYGVENIKDEVSSIKYKKNSNTKDGKDAEMGTDPFNSTYLQNSGSIWDLHKTDRMQDIFMLDLETGLKAKLKDIADIEQLKRTQESFNAGDIYYCYDQQPWLGIVQEAHFANGNIEFDPALKRTVISGLNNIIVITKDNRTFDINFSYSDENGCMIKYREIAAGEPMPKIKFKAQVSTEIRFAAIDNKAVPGYDNSDCSIVSKDEYEEIIEKTKKDSKGRLITAPNVTLFDGEKTDISLSTEIFRQLGYDNMDIRFTPYVMDNNIVSLAVKFNREIDSGRRAEIQKYVRFEAGQYGVLPLKNIIGIDYLMIVNCQIIEPDDGSNGNHGSWEKDKKEKSDPLFDREYLGEWKMPELDIKEGKKIKSLRLNIKDNGTMTIRYIDMNGDTILLDADYDVQDGMVIAGNGDNIYVRCYFKDDIFSAEMPEFDMTVLLEQVMPEANLKTDGEEIKNSELKIEENIKDEVSSIKYKKNSNTKDGKDAEMGTDPINSLDIKQGWKTIAESYKVNSNIPVQVASVATDYGQVVFGNAYSKDDGAWISTTDDIDRNIFEVRIVAIDIDGNILLQNGGGSSTVNKTNTLQCRFDTELSKVSLFEIQIRNNVEMGTDPINSTFKTVVLKNSIQAINLSNNQKTYDFYVLDMASGNVKEYENVQDFNHLTNILNSVGKGDMAFVFTKDRCMPVINWVRNARPVEKADERQSHYFYSAKWYPDDNIITNEGKRYYVYFKDCDENGCEIYYREIMPGESLPKNVEREYVNENNEIVSIEMELFSLNGTEYSIDTERIIKNGDELDETQISFLRKISESGKVNFWEKLPKIKAFKTEKVDMSSLGAILPADKFQIDKLTVIPNDINGGSLCLDIDLAGSFHAVDYTGDNKTDAIMSSFTRKVTNIMPENKAALLELCGVNGIHYFMLVKMQNAGSDLKDENEEIKNSELKIEEEEEEEKGYGIRDKGLGNVLADARLINNEEATTKKGTDPINSFTPSWIGLPEGWDRDKAWKEITSYLENNIKRDLPESNISYFNDDIKHGPVEISYHTQKYQVESPVSKARIDTEKQTETGPQPDGLIIRIYLTENIEQMVRPQTLDKTFWKVDFLKIYLPELKLFLMANISYGNQTDQTLLSKYRNLNGIMANIIESTQTTKITEVDNQRYDTVDKKYMDKMAGEVLFCGEYKHISRRREIETPSTLLVTRGADGEINALAYMPWMGSYDMAVGDKEGKLSGYFTWRAESEGKPGFDTELELGDGKAVLNRHGIREDKVNVELSVAEGARFSPNSRPDSYCADNIFMRGLDIAVETSKEFEVYDWDNSGEAMASYTIEVYNAGKEEVVVPAGTFEANHYVLTQTSTGNTWYKKQNGHITDYWVMDDGIIVRVLRHREPYEIQLMKNERIQGSGFRGQGSGKVLADARANNTVSKGEYEICGTVTTEMSEGRWEEFFARMDAAKTEKELNDIVTSERQPGKEPAANVEVKLIGRYGNKPFERITSTDNNGNYWFKDLPIGSYRISCQDNIVYNRTGSIVTMVGEGDKPIEFVLSGKKRAEMDIELRDNNLLTVTGRVLDQKGRPITNAVVTGTSTPLENGGIGETSEQTRIFSPQIITGKTDAEGRYQLAGFEAAHYINVFRSLINTNKDARGPYKFFADITVRADGYVPAERKAYRVPLAGEEQLYRARRLLKAYEKLDTDAKVKENPEPVWPFAKCEGSKLVGVDIVMKSERISEELRTKSEEFRNPPTAEANLKTDGEEIKNSELKIKKEENANTAVGNDELVVEDAEKETVSINSSLIFSESAYDKMKKELVQETAENTKESSIDQFVGIWENPGFIGNDEGRPKYTYLLIIYEDGKVIHEELELGVYKVEEGKYDIKQNAIIICGSKGEEYAICKIDKIGKLIVAQKAYSISTRYNKIMSTTDISTKTMKQWFSLRSVVPFLGKWYLFNHIIVDNIGNNSSLVKSAECKFNNDSTFDITLDDGTGQDAISGFQCNFKDGKINILMGNSIFGVCRIDDGDLIIEQPNLGTRMIFKREKPSDKKELTEADKGEIKALVLKFWRKIREKDMDALISMHIIESNEHREQLEKYLGMILDDIRPGDPGYPSEENLRIVDVFAENDYFAATLLQKVSDEWIVRDILVKEEAGEYKMNMMTPDYLEQMLVVKTASGEKIAEKIKEKNIEIWERFDDKKLNEVYNSLIAGQERGIIAAKYAKENGMKLVSVFTEEVIRKRLEKLKALTPEELKREILSGSDPMNIKVEEQESGREEKERLKAEKPSAESGFGPVDFEGFYPDSEDGGRKLDELMAAKDRELRAADEIIETVRNGLRRYSGRENVLRWIGNMFIWGKEPQNIKAIELMYHASESKDFGTAVYFGLSVVDDMTAEIIAAMGEVAMETDDYHNQIGRIHWGCKNRGKVDELTEYIKQYLRDEDPAKREKAKDLIDYFADSKAFMAKKAEEYKKEMEQKYAGRKDEFKERLLTGSSKERMSVLKEEGLFTILDESFIDGLAACLKDKDDDVRNQAARILGNKFVWSGKEQNERVIELLTALLDDPSREVRYTANYFGLSTVSKPSEKLVGKMLETVLDDREINYYGRAIGGVRRNSKSSDEILKGWMEAGGEKAVKAYEIYEDVLGKPLPKEYAERYAGQKSDVHAGAAAMIFRLEPIGKEELSQTVLSCLNDNNLLGKASELYIIEKRESAVGVVICENLADRNAVRDALAKKGLTTQGYVHGMIGVVGSGWMEQGNLDKIREQYKQDKVRINNVR